MTDNSANHANAQVGLDRPEVAFEENSCTCNEEAKLSRFLKISKQNYSEAPMPVPLHE
ncbi:hypothetical protein FHT60_003540 [Novosphingobium sp. BK486]|nr:hypothetical protein [Novosphingobium sp. BK280]MBB3380343.1 hypothetical protein [Novosphingobium sp. BK258]MBB3450828.1 hypothetical protein [Novosphingobium sp. BK352]MBB3479203.1 hypothetical protein [Novosphingobium sp. BK369]MBB3538437.1 hypothetical protein [Novosphingobium sp. BK486]MBB3622421.1 hypothetical protein [Novosphingobium sp. BK592]